MSGPTPCLRHAAHLWLAYCDDCTAWHLSRQIKRHASSPPGQSRPGTRPRHLPAA